MSTVSTDSRLQHEATDYADVEAVIESAIALPSELRIGRDRCAEFDDAIGREWLVTNGIGGYAAGTVGGARTRRYHGLLVAAFNPPLGRTVTVAKLDIAADYNGHVYDLATNEYHGGVVSPTGYRTIQSFSLLGSLPVWQHVFSDVVLEHTIWMEHGENTTYVQISVLRASAPVGLRCLPLVTWRDYHAQTHGGWSPGIETRPGGFEIRAFDGAQPFRVLCDKGSFTPGGQWYWQFRQRVESYRGLDDHEDLFQPGQFDIRLAPGESAVFVLTAEPDRNRNGSTTLHSEMHRQRALLTGIDAEQPSWIRQLILAADQFIVARGTDDGRSVIAGYPWFGDWGRDTMIALPGLTLATGRREVARRILLTFAEHVSEGMLPNRFPDHGEAPEYNTVDATLWYFHAIDRYLTGGADDALGAQLYPVLQDIIEWHRRGTRYGIHVDSSDGLLAAGEPGVQLTWMDARVGDWVVTPRIGKPVEINALWHNALVVMTALAGRYDDAATVTRYRSDAAAVAQAFRTRFWNEDGNCLYDVIDGPDGEPDHAGRRVDASLRPNQLFAVSLPAELLTPQQARAVVDVCARELYTPVGMRSLASSDPRYVSHYGGGPLQRDGAYHQGTVWSWLLGPFASAHYRVYRDAKRALSFLEGVEGHLEDACIGNVSEIFDADAPHSPRGAPAQAWSVAEILRAWLQLSSAAADQTFGVIET